MISRKQPQKAYPHSTLKSTLPIGSHFPFSHAPDFDFQEHLLHAFPRN